jgi:hypothetical protein
MGIQFKIRVPFACFAFLVCVLLSPVPSECKNAVPAPTPQGQCQSEAVARTKAWDTLWQFADDLHKMEREQYKLDESMYKTQSLANNLDFFKSYLVNYLNSVKGSGTLTKEQQDDYNSVAQGLSNMTALQSRVAARIAVLQKSLDELKPRIATAKKSLDVASGEFDKADEAHRACEERIANPPAPTGQQGGKPATPTPPAAPPRRPGGSLNLTSTDVKPNHEDKFQPFGKYQGGEKFTFTATSADLNHTRLDSNGKLTEQMVNHFDYTIKISGDSDLSSLRPGDTISIDIDGSDKRKLVGTGGAWGVTADVGAAGLDNVVNGKKCYAGAGFSDGYHASCEGHFEFKVPPNATKVVISLTGSFGIASFATYTWEKPH